MPYTRGMRPRLSWLAPLALALALLAAAARVWAPDTTPDGTVTRSASCAVGEQVSTADGGTTARVLERPCPDR